MSDFLLELRSEEIPARMQAGARAELEKLFRREMAAAGVSVGDLTVWSTPRRLALIARDLPDVTADVSLEEKGPPEGAPDQAIDGFCRKNGVRRDQIELRDVKGRNTWFAVINKPGRSVKDLLAEAIPAIIRDFSWPKSMRWGDASRTTESLRWVRPLSGIVAILGEELVECEVDGVHSSYATHGHRFHCPGEITIGSADDYAEKLRACHVIVDHEERQDAIRTKAAEAAEAAGLKLVEDEGLVIENAGLTEWPVPLLGRFDESFLDVPPEVIQLTARVNQKYFVCHPPQVGEDRLANAFVCTANITAEDPEVVVDGNRKVLAARLSDARFFWEQDRKTPLADHAKKLERITFHEKLGTVADKVERVAKLARWLVEEGIIAHTPLPAGEGPGVGGATSQSSNTHPNPSLKGGASLADLTEQAARLCKADLVTEMVGEFPELQGLMGGYYARAEGLTDAVADAIRDHYKPVGQGDEVPTAPVTVAVSLADKLDTLARFFAADMLPTGSKDPFALRRAALGFLALILNNGLRVSYQRLLMETGAATGYPSLEPFLIDRLKVQQREAGVRHDLIDAVFALGGEDDLVRLLARVHALQAFIDTDNGTNLLAGYKRAANILKKEEWQPQDGLSYTPEAAEKALIDALDAAEPKAAAAIEAEDFEGAMSALASLRAPIDAFFDEVTVNDEDQTKRSSRLDLLARFRVAVHNVADFSKIEG